MRRGQLADRGSRVEAVPVCEEPLLAIFPPDANVWRMRRRIVAQHGLLFERPHAQVNRLIFGWLRGRLAPRPAMELDNLGSAARMVGVGLGVSIVPERVAADVQAQFGAWCGHRCPRCRARSPCAAPRQSRTSPRWAGARGAAGAARRAARGARRRKRGKTRRRTDAQSQPRPAQGLETVAALRSFTAAARRLELSQPAISTQVSELEQRLGMRLIERVGKKGLVIAAGLEVIAHARRIDTRWKRPASRNGATARDSRARPRRRTAGHSRRHPAARHCLVPAWCTEHRGGAAHRNDARAVPRLAKNELDFAIGTLPVDHKAIDIEPLRLHPLLAVFLERRRVFPTRSRPPR